MDGSQKVCQCTVYLEKISVWSMPQVALVEHFQLYIQHNDIRDVTAELMTGGKSSCAFSDIRVFNPYAQSNRTSHWKPAIYRRHEQEKRRAYEDRILQVEHGSFCPIVLSTTDGMGPAAQVIYGKLVSEISKRRSENYSQSMRWIRCLIFLD